MLLSTNKQTTQEKEKIVRQRSRRSPEGDKMTSNTAKGGGRAGVNHSWTGGSEVLPCSAGHEPKKTRACLSFWTESVSKRWYCGSLAAEN